MANVNTAQTRPGRSGRLLAGTVVLFAAVVAVRFVLGDELIRSPLDLRVYRAGAETVLDGEPLYAMRMPTNGLPFTYPFFAALLFIPLSLVPFWAAKVLLSAVSLAALVAICVCTLRMAGVRRFDHAMALGLGLASFALFTEPVVRTFRLGQINLVVVALVFLDFTVFRNTRWHGVLIGLATGIKVTPGLFIVYLAVIDRRRALLVASASFAATVALGLLVQPAQAWAFWTQHMFDPSRVGRVSYVSNQSILGVISRLVSSDHPSRLLTLGLSAVVVAGAFCAARLLQRAGKELLAVNAIGLAGLLASPISWAHHWVWFIPALVGLAATISPDRLHSPDRGAWLRPLCTFGWAVLFLIGPMWYVPPEPVRDGIHLTPWQMLLSASYLLAAAGYLTWLLFRELPLRGAVLSRPPKPSNCADQAALR